MRHIFGYLLVGLYLAISLVAAPTHHIDHSDQTIGSTSWSNEVVSVEDGFLQPHFFSLKSNAGKKYNQNVDDNPWLFASVTRVVLNSCCVAKVAQPKALLIQFLVQCRKVKITFPFHYFW